MSARRTPSTQRIRERSEPLRQKIGKTDFVVSGTVHMRTKVCGRKNCRCATDPDYRHGPYHEWTRRKDGKLQHKVVTPEQARLLEPGIANRREILSLLDRWEDESAAEILAPGADDTG